MLNREIIYHDDQDRHLRLDVFLTDFFKSEGLSRSVIHLLIASKKVLVNNREIKKSYILSEGEVISINAELERKHSRIKPENIPIDIIYEEEEFAVIYKPTGQIVHPAPGVFSGTLVNGLLYHFKHLSSMSGADRPGIIHRLDKDTSGILVVAKTDRMHAALSQIFQDREIDKYYKAIILGTPDFDGCESYGTISTYINRSRKDPTKMTVDTEGKHAVTHWKVLESIDYFSLLELKIETGRTHQIRVHMRHINHPVLCDSVYSSDNEILSRVPDYYRKKIKNLLKKYLKRQALHSYKLCFNHPDTGKRMEFVYDMPEDMKKAWDYLSEMVF